MKQHALANKRESYKTKRCMCFSYHGCIKIALKLNGMKQPFFMDQELRQDTSVWLLWSHNAWGLSWSRILPGSFAHMFGYQCWLSAETSVGPFGQDTGVWFGLPWNVVAGFKSWASPEREPGGSQVTLYDLVSKIMCHLISTHWDSHKVPAGLKGEGKETLWESDNFRDQHEGLAMLLWPFFSENTICWDLCAVVKNHIKITRALGSGLRRNSGGKKAWFKKKIFLLLVW